MMWGCVAVGKRQGQGFGSKKFRRRKGGGFHPELGQPCSPRALPAAALDCRVRSCLRGSLGLRLLRALKTRVRTLKQICSLWGSRACALSVQRGERFWFSSKWISACSMKPPGINWKHWWPLGAERQKQAETGNKLPLAPGCAGGGACGRFALTLPTLCALRELYFQRCQDKVCRCNYRRVFFSWKEAAHLFSLRPCCPQWVAARNQDSFWNPNAPFLSPLFPHVFPQAVCMAHTGSVPQPPGVGAHQKNSHGLGKKDFRGDSQCHYKDVCIQVFFASLLFCGWWI